MMLIQTWKSKPFNKGSGMALFAHRYRMSAKE